MRAYWAAWGDILALIGDLAREAIASCWIQALSSLVLIGLVLGEALLISMGDYWQAVGLLVGVVALTLLIGGHVMAWTIMQEKALMEHDRQLKAAWDAAVEARRQARQKDEA